jgi:hypothetical protein
MFVLAILAAAGKRNKKRRNIAKLPGASPVEMMRITCFNGGK